MLFAGAIGVAFFFITNPLSCGDYPGGYVSDGEAMGFGFAAFLITAVILHIKPELMGKPNRTDDDDEKPSG